MLLFQWYLWQLEHQIIRELVFLELFDRHKNDDFRIDWLRQ